ncbi:TetR/AcrR family transcriptional regulator [Mucilaginibacter sp.]|uniref:TetR/AcrR family transcriptional regulator n=1 Tax=Mucilaginibacter sp. TaxID=1882438 RepID=UPI00262C4AED|nr:TetR/AcrR family transcriptional regulator [Mucilaginibacter sp.]MDB4924405.1 transcriptional regulator, TetR family [Mucilaginibacter sp.]
MDKKQQILSAALRLFVANGFDGTPTAKIAIEAAVANGTLFYHYKTKEELIVSLYNQLKEEQANYILPIISGPGFITDKFRNIFIQSVHWALSNPDKFYYIQQFNFSPHLAQVPKEVLKQQTIIYADFIEEGVKRKLLKQQDPDLIIALFNGQVYGIYHYLTSGEFTPALHEKTINDSYEMVWDMMKYM